MGNKEVMAKNVGGTLNSGQGASLLIVFSLVQPNSPLFTLICEHNPSAHCSAHLQTSITFK